MRPLLAAILFFTGLFPAHAELNAWNFRVLLDGREIGRHHFTLRGQPLAAQRHRISAPNLQIDLWYAGGRWIALEAPAKGGRHLRYELM